MKLELKHLAGYLPYGLKIRTFREGQILFIEDINASGEFLDYFFENCHSRINSKMIYKPILRPLSDLTKEIEVRGEKLVPYIELAKKYAETSGYNYDIRIYKSKCYCYSKSSEIEFRFNGRDFILNGKLVNAQYHLFLKLLEWHFDIYGLIESGLAISIYDVEEAER